MGTYEKLVPGELLKMSSGDNIREKQILIKNKQAEKDCLNINTNEERAHV